MPGQARQDATRVPVPGRRRLGALKPRKSSALLAWAACASSTTVGLIMPYSKLPTRIANTTVAAMRDRWGWKRCRSRAARSQPAGSLSCASSQAATRPWGRLSAASAGKLSLNSHKGGACWKVCDRVGTSVARAAAMAACCAASESGASDSQANCWMMTRWIHAAWYEGAAGLALRSPQPNRVAARWNSRSWSADSRYKASISWVSSSTLLSTCTRRGSSNA